MFRLFFVLCLVAACTDSPASKPTSEPKSTSAPLSASTSMKSSSSSSPSVTTVTLKNKTAFETGVFVSFGSDSVIKATDWTFCKSTTPLDCWFSVPANGEKKLPSAGYLNVTLSVNQPVSCGSTKAEINVNHPGAYDVADISLVDGFNARMSIDLNGVILGPPVGKEGNEKVFGVYPLGCDVCTARQNPPCGIPAGSTGCKTGSQYKPDVPCQAQGSNLGGGGSVTINILP